MAKAAATIETIKNILETRSENINQRMVVRFIPNDHVKLVVLDDKGTLRREEQASPLKGVRKSLNTSSSSPAMGELSQCLLHWEYLPLFQLRREVLTLTLPRDSGKVKITPSLLTSK